MFLADFHVHSTFSDGKHTIPDVVDFYGQRGFGAIALTDHVCDSVSGLGRAAGYLGKTLTRATFPLYREILRSEAARAWDQYRMVLIPGVELTKNSVSNHRSSHVLALGIDSWISADGDVREWCARIHSQEALSVVAHPVSTQRLEKQTLHIWDRREELAEHFDAWEVGSGIDWFDDVATSGLPLLASTDLHRFSQISGWKTLLSCPRTQSDILNAIVKQDLSFFYFMEKFNVTHTYRGIESCALDHGLGTELYWNLRGTA